MGTANVIRKVLAICTRLSKFHMIQPRYRRGGASPRRLERNSHADMAHEAALEQ
jgi:hypothetical protein